MRAELFRLSGCCTCGRDCDEACVLTARLNIVALRKASVGRVRAALGDGRLNTTLNIDIHGLWVSACSSMFVLPLSITLFVVGLPNAYPQKVKSRGASLNHGGYLGGS